MQAQTKDSLTSKATPRAPAHGSLGTCPALPVIQADAVPVLWEWAGWPVARGRPAGSMWRPLRAWPVPPIPGMFVLQGPVYSVTHVRCANPDSAWSHLSHSLRHPGLQTGADHWVSGPRPRAPSHTVPPQLPTLPPGRRLRPRASTHLHQPCPEQSLLWGPPGWEGQHAWDTGQPGFQSRGCRQAFAGKWGLMAS